MNDRTPGSSYDNPIWHCADWRIWLCPDERGADLYAWAHEDADLDDPTDRRHGDAPTLQQARADIDDYINCQEHIAYASRRRFERSTAEVV